MATWIFQANPDRFDVDGYLSARHRISWLAKQHAEDIDLGDVVYIWRAQGHARASAAIIARCTVTGKAERRAETTSDLRFWRDPADASGAANRITLQVEEISPGERGLSKESIEQDDVLTGLGIIKVPRLTNYPVTPEQSARLDSLWTQHLATVQPQQAASARFERNRTYSREQVYMAVGVRPHTGGPWYTGYCEHNGETFIFCNIGTAGRTGHDYRNEWRDDRLVWYGKTGSRLNQPMVQRMIAPGARVHLFTRQGGDRGPFTYQGRAIPDSTVDVQPVQIIWRFEQSTDRPAEALAEEVLTPAQFAEGAVRQITINAAERSRAAREACIEHWGCQCAVCDMTFGQRYGELGDGFIHVHHLQPIASRGEQYHVDPVTEMRPVCPNCHAMLHRQEPPLSIEALREKLTL